MVHHFGHHHHHGHRHHHGHHYHGLHHLGLHRHGLHHHGLDHYKLPGLILSIGITFIFIMDGTGRIAGIVLTAVGALGFVLLIFLDVSLFKEKHNVSHFQF